MRHLRMNRRRSRAASQQAGSRPAEPRSPELPESSRGAGRPTAPADLGATWRARRPLLVVVLAALVVKLVVLAQLHAHPLLQPEGSMDGGVYLRLAQRCLAGDWALGPDVYYVSPLYIYSLALALWSSGGSLLAAKVA